MSWTDEKAAHHYEIGEQWEREAKERYKARVEELEAALSALALNIRTALQFDSLDPAAARALRPVRDVVESLIGRAMTLSDGDNSQ